MYTNNDVRVSFILIIIFVFIIYIYIYLCMGYTVA
jgi:hypothetical protein